jgi:hypothetical protein
MKMRNPVVLALSAILLLAVALTVLSVVNWYSFRYSASGGHQSAFFGAYSPSQIIKSFNTKGYAIATGSGISSAGGSKVVTNKATFDASFAIRPGMRASFMSTLTDDLVEQLTRNGGTIIAKSGDPQTGFHLTYKDGTSAGNVALLPLKDQASNGLNPPLPEGTQEVHEDIVISEKWFPDDTVASQEARNYIK